MNSFDESVREIQLVNLAMDSGIAFSDVPLFETVIYRLMKGGEHERALVYVTSLAHFLREAVIHQKAEATKHLDLSEALSLVRTAVGGVVVAVSCNKLELARNLICDVLNFYPHAFTYCALRELSLEHPLTGFRVITKLDPVGKDSVRTLLAEVQMNPLMQAEIVVTDCLAEIDPSFLIACGAPKDEYCNEAQSVVKILHSEITVEEIARALKEKFTIPYSHANASATDILNWATKVFSAIDSLRPRLPKLNH